LTIRIRLPDPSGFVQPNLRSLLVFPLNRFVDFPSMDGYLAWGIDSKPYFVAAHIHDRDDDIIANDDTFVALS
jgi:hypothetical protein